MVKKLSCNSCGSLKRFPHTFTNASQRVQWNLDLRKILGVDKIFLKSRFFLISNSGKPLKVTNNPLVCTMNT